MAVAALEEILHLRLKRAYNLGVYPLLLEIASSGQPAAVSKNREPEAEGWRLFKRGHHSGAREGYV